MSRSETPKTPSYRGLLALVIILGVLILVGVVALIAAAVLRARNPVVSGQQPYAASLAAPGAHIEAANIDGNRILVRLAGPNGEELVILDAGSGRVIGRIAVNTGP